MKDYIEIIEKNRDEMLKTLADLIAFPSVVSDAEGDYPFGIEVERAYEFMMKKAEEDGFITKNVDNWGGHIDFPGETDDVVAVVGHLDVVPAGDLDNWNTDPFKAEIIDGRIYGRGSVDDKGPLLAGYYAVRALKEAGFRPNKTIRVILGLDEETNWYGMEYYMEREKAPVSGFSPDAVFPVIYGEKGTFSANLSKAVSLDGAGPDAGAGDGFRLVSAKGGTVSNAVPESAEALIACGGRKDELISIIEKYKADHPDKADDVSYEAVGESESGEVIKLKAKGLAAHASEPYLGKNAISILCDILGEIDFEQDDINGLVRFYNDHIGYDLYGERMAVGLSDEPSGPLTFNAGIVDISGNSASLVIDIRYPITCTLEQVKDGLHQVCDPEGITIEQRTQADPLYKPADDPLVVTLMDVYRKYTGDKDAKPITMGGATYARAVPNTVAFGPVFTEKEPDLCHMPNEYIELESLMTSTKIFADALYLLAK